MYIWYWKVKNVACSFVKKTIFQILEFAVLLLSMSAVNTHHSIASVSAVAKQPVTHQKLLWWVVTADIQLVVFTNVYAENTCEKFVSETFYYYQRN